jgi:RNA polymerase sigma-70 factor (ECF subfamily)
MTTGIQEIGVARYPSYLVGVGEDTSENLQAIYEANRHRLYALAFWTTGNELQAEAMLERVFVRAFSASGSPSEEMLDRTLVAEARQLAPYWGLTLNHPISTEVLAVRHNTKRIDLERAVLQLPTTERFIYLMHDGEGYSHARVARTLEISEQESLTGLHQSRLELRALLAHSR